VEENRAAIWEYLVEENRKGKASLTRFWTYEIKGCITPPHTETIQCIWDKLDGGGDIKIGLLKNPTSLKKIGIVQREENKNKTRGGESPS